MINYHKISFIHLHKLKSAIVKLHSNNIISVFPDGALCELFGNNYHCQHADFVFLCMCNVLFRVLFSDTLLHIVDVCIFMFVCILF